MPFSETKISISNTVTTSPTLNKFMSVARLMDWSLPGDLSNDIYVVGISGGADSSALAILLSAMFPDVDFIFVFTDTKAEASGTIEAIERFEEFTGRKVRRVAQPDGLYGLVEQFGNYLPSGQSRYCTRILKTETYEDFMEDIRGNSDVMVHSFVGLRADEPSRSGLDSSMPWLRSHYPMRDLGMVRADVFNILEETVSIPSFYRFRSRSGCGICPFMRPSEMLGTMSAYPEVALKAQSYEKLSVNDQERFQVYGEDWSGMGITHPLPVEMDIRNSIRKQAKLQINNKTSKPNDGTLDLFENVTVYVGVEYLQDSLMGMFDGTKVGTSGVWFSDLVGWSTSKGGIARKLNTHYHTRLDTAEVFGLSEKDFSEQYGQSIMEIEIRPEMIDLKSAESTIKERDGMITDEHGEPLLIDGKKAFFGIKQYTKEEKKAFRQSGKTAPRVLELIDGDGNILPGYDIKDRYGISIAPHMLSTSKYNSDIQSVKTTGGHHVYVNGVPVYRKKKGNIISQGTFSWRKGEPLAMIRMAASAIKKTLQVESYKQQVRELERFRGDDSWEGETLESLEKKLASKDIEHGFMLNMYKHEPSQRRPEAKTVEEIPCFACSK